MARKSTQLSPSLTPNLGKESVPTHPYQDLLRDQIRQREEWTVGAAVRRGAPQDPRLWGGPTGFKGEIEVSCMLFERSLSIFSMKSLKQHILKYILQFPG